MKILVTGAAGFIGYHLVNALLKQNVQIVGIDNINNYYDVGLKYRRLENQGIFQHSIAYNQPVQSNQQDNYTFIKLDISDEPAIDKLFATYQFDVVCNLAAQAGVRYSLKNPSAYINSNLVGFANILEGCRNYKIKHLVYASSSSVYGLNKKVPFSTNDRVDHPISLYAATKKSNELMAHSYAHLYNIPTTGLRFFTVYGPWGRPDMAYFLFTERILKGKPIKVFNKGKMSRDFTYVDDIVNGIVKILKTPAKPSRVLNNGSKTPAKVYNIGNNSPVKLLDFIETLEVTLQKPAKKIMMPMQPGDVYTTYADCTDLMNDFGYQPNTKLEEGIRQFTDWYVNYYQPVLI